MEILTILTINTANIVSVWLAARNNRYTWGVGFVGVALTAVLFWLSGHYMSCAFNAYSALMCVVGHFRWKKSVRENDRAIRWNKPYGPIAVCAGLSLAIYLVDRAWANDPVLDSVGTAVSIVATYLLVKQDVNAWLLYLLSDLIYIYLGVASGRWEYVLIYGVMMGLAIYGTREFIRKYGKIRKEKDGKTI